MKDGDRPSNFAGADQDPRSSVGKIRRTSGRSCSFGVLYMTVPEALISDCPSLTSYRDRRHGSWTVVDLGTADRGPRRLSSRSAGSSTSFFLPAVRPISERSGFGAGVRRILAAAPIDRGKATVARPGRRPSRTRAGRFSISPASSCGGLLPLERGSKTRSRRLASRRSVTQGRFQCGFGELRRQGRCGGDSDRTGPGRAG